MQQLLPIQSLKRDQTMDLEKTTKCFQLVLQLQNRIFCDLLQVSHWQDLLLLLSRMKLAIQSKRWNEQCIAYFTSKSAHGSIKLVRKEESSI